jgi:pre-mRNA cleavage complex 2 protein Pcf11
VVKNVGTPYTLFLGRNLYQTFMNAYTLVDSQTRKKLDEMLKTWKEPVPGSLDTRPVFPVEITRSIENALIKARTAALQQQQARSQQEVLGRSRGITTPPSWTHSPTPAPRYPPAQNPNFPQYGMNGQPNGYPPSVSDNLYVSTVSISCVLIYR